MISRRNYFTITALMLVLMFLFLFSGVYKDVLNDYDMNIYSDTREQQGIERKVQPEKLFKDNGEEKPGYIAYVGKNENLSLIIGQWCRYARRNLKTASTCAELEFKEKPYLICLDGPHITAKDIPSLQSWVKQGIHLIYCGTPDLRVMMRKEMKELMGIRTIREEDVDLEGIVLHEGFLLGGGYTYTVKDEVTKDLQDLSLTTDWYEMSSGTKAYMTGLLDESIYGETQNEYLPAILWRNSIGSTKVFVINGDYMETITGLGFLSACVNQIEDYTLYPVVNAQNMVILNYPSFTPENDEQMMQLYARDSYRVLREVVWPGLTAVLTNTDSKMTCMLTTKMDYNNKTTPSREDLVFFMKLLREREAEAGISCSQTSNVALPLKLNTDREFLQENLPDYRFQAAYIADELPASVQKLLELRGFIDVHTFLSDYHPTGDVVSMAGTENVYLTSINKGDSHMYSEDLREKAIETVLAYSTVTEDLQYIIYPRDAGDQWQNVYRNFAKFTDTFYDAFDTFEELTLSESGGRAKLFLTTEYEQSRKGNVITLHSNYDTGYFILRTHEEVIDEIEGAEYEEIEEDAWLITLQKQDVKIKVVSEEENKDKAVFRRSS